MQIFIKNVASYALLTVSVCIIAKVSRLSGLLQEVRRQNNLFSRVVKSGRRHQAVQAMIALGFDWVDVDAALEDLLQFYEFNWDYIEANSYYQLVDWILNRRPLAVPNLACQQKDVQSSEPAITELSRFQALNPFLMPLELPVQTSSLAEDEDPKDGGNPPSPVEESHSARNYPMDLDIGPLSRFRVLNPMLKPSEKAVHTEDTARGSAQTEHMDSIANPRPSPCHSSSFSGKRSTDPASPDSVLKQVDCSSQTYKHISLYESGQRVIPYERSRTELDKGKQISQVTNLQGKSHQGFRYHLDSNLIDNPQRKMHFKDTFRTEATDHSSPPRFHEMKVTKEYLSDVLTGTGMWFGQITVKESDAPDMQCETFSGFDCEPFELDTIQLLVREMSHEYFGYMSLASSLTSGSSSGSTSTFNSPFEDAESPPESPTVPKL